MSSQPRRGPDALLESHPNPQDHLGCFLALYTCIFDKVAAQRTPTPALQGLNERFFEIFQDRYSCIFEGRTKDLPPLWDMAAAYCYPSGLFSPSRGLVENEHQAPPLKQATPPIAWLLNQLTARKAALAAVILAHIFCDLTLASPQLVPSADFHTVNRHITNCFVVLRCHEDESTWDPILLFLRQHLPYVPDFVAAVVRQIACWMSD